MGGNEGGGGERWNFFGVRSVVQKSPTDPGSETSTGETFFFLSCSLSASWLYCSYVTACVINLQQIAEIVIAISWSLCRDRPWWGPPLCFFCEYNRAASSATVELWLKQNSPWNEWGFSSDRWDYADATILSNIFKCRKRDATPVHTSRHKKRPSYPLQYWTEVLHCFKRKINR